MWVIVLGCWIVSVPLKGRRRSIRFRIPRRLPERRIEGELDGVTSGVSYECAIVLVDATGGCGLLGEVL